MADAQKVAIGRVVLRQKGHLVALRPHGDLLTMETMIYADEVVPADSLEEEATATETKVAARELEVARQLIEMLSAPFDPERFRDDHRDAVLALIERKVAGEEIAIAPAPAAAEPVPDLMAALQASIAAVGKHAEATARRRRRRPSRRRRSAPARARPRRPARPRASRDARSRERPAGELPGQARLREDARAARRRSGARPTPAPRRVSSSTSTPRGGMHWDLRLEHDGVLVSWALPRGLPERPKVNHIAPHTEDHPLEYLDFEAEIPKGSYGAGTIRIWDRGTYDELKWEPRKVEVALHGERVEGRYALFAIGEGDRRDWMIHRMDAGPTGASRCPTASSRCSRARARSPRATTAGPTRSSGTACGRSPTASPAPCACAAATCSTSPRATPSSRACTRALSTAPRDPRRRDRRARRARAPELRDARRAHERLGVARPRARREIARSRS